MGGVFGVFLVHLGLGFALGHCFGVVVDGLPVRKVGVRWWCPDCEVLWFAEGLGVCWVCSGPGLLGVPSLWKPRGVD